MGIRISQTGLEVLVSATPNQRVSQSAVETVVQPTTPSVRVSQDSIEALVKPTLPNIRVSQTLTEVLFKQTSYPFAADSKFKGASNKGGSKNQGDTTLILTKPTGTADGDTLIASISDNAGTGTSITPPSGWTLVGTRQTSGTTLGQAVYQYVVPSGAPTTFTWTFTGTVNTAGILNILGNVGAYDAVGQSVNASSANILAPSITNNAANALLLFIGTVAANTSVTPPTGMTEGPLSDQANTGVTTEIAFSTPTATGSTGTRTGVSAIAGVNIGTLVAFSVLNIEREEFSGDAVIMPSFTANAAFIPAPLQSKFTSLPGSFDSTPGHIMPGHFDSAVEVSFTADAVLKTTNSGSWLADGVLLRAATSSLAADAALLKSVAGSAAANAVLLNTLGSMFVTDSLLLYVGSSTFTANSVIKAESQSTFTADAVLFKTTTGSALADSVILRTISETVTSDSLLQTIVQVGFTADGVLFATVGATLAANSVLQGSVTGDFTSDSRLLVVIQESFTVDSLLLNIVSNSFAADAVLLDTIDGEFTSDARLYPSPESVRNPRLRADDPAFILVGEVTARLTGNLPDIRLIPDGADRVGHGRFVKRVKVI